MLEDGETATLSEIGRALALSPARAHRILGTLEEAGFVVRSPETKAYALTFGAPSENPSASFDLVLDAVYPHLEWLRDESGETTHLSVLAGRHVYFAASVESPQVMRVTSRVGRRVPALLTAAGKVLLAQRPDEQLQRLVRAEFADPGRAAEVRKQLAEARRTGMARNLGETEQGMATLAVPIRPASGLPAHAISSSGPESRINPRRAVALTAVERRHLELLNRAAARVQVALHQ